MDYFVKKSEGAIIRERINIIMTKKAKRFVLLITVEFYKFVNTRKFNGKCILYLTIIRSRKIVMLRNVNVKD